MNLLAGEALADHLGVLVDEDVGLAGRGGVQAPGDDAPRRSRGAMELKDGPSGVAPHVRVGACWAGGG